MMLTTYETWLIVHDLWFAKLTSFLRYSVIISLTYDPLKLRSLTADSKNKMIYILSSVITKMTSDTHT
jgi:hypothetical protein